MFFVDQSSTSETSRSAMTSTPGHSRALRSGKETHTVNTRTGVFSKKCLFCSKSRKQLNNKCEILVTCSTETIQVNLQKYQTHSTTLTLSSFLYRLVL